MKLTDLLLVVPFFLFHHCVYCLLQNVPIISYIRHIVLESPFLGSDLGRLWDRVNIITQVNFFVLIVV